MCLIFHIRHGCMGCSFSYNVECFIIWHLADIGKWSREATQIHLLCFSSGRPWDYGLTHVRIEDFWCILDLALLAIVITFYESVDVISAAEMSDYVSHVQIIQWVKFSDWEESATNTPVQVCPDFMLLLLLETFYIVIYVNICSY